MTVRQQLDGVYKKTRKQPKLLRDEIKIPQLFQSVYNVYLELKSQDTQSNISHHQLLTYQQLFDVKFIKFEIKMFSTLDIIFNKVANKRK